MAVTGASNSVASSLAFLGEAYLNEGAPPRSLDKWRTWLTAQRCGILDQLNEKGAVLLRGFTAILPDKAFLEVLRCLGTSMGDYLGGSSPRTRLTSSTYTATELPGDYSIALHHEMSYLPTSPEAICFHCVQPAPVGGRSVLAHSLRVRAALAPEIENAFRARGVLITRALPPRGSLYLASGMSRPWQDVFATNDPAHVEAICKNRQWTTKWCDDGTLRLQHGATPACRAHPRTEELIWFNQAHYFSPECMVRWAERDGRLLQARYIRRLIDRQDHEHLNQVTFADGSPIPSSYLISIWEALAASESYVALQSGDILVLDNYKVMHGRESFSGQRQLHVGLVERLV